MPVEQVPSFWDHLTGGIQKGIAMSRENKQRDEDKQERRNTQATSILTELFKSGDVDAEALNTQLKNMGIQGIAPGPTVAGAVPATPQPIVQKSKGQRRREILAQGQQAVDALSDAEKADLGFPTAAERAIEGGKVAEANLTTIRADAMQRYMRNEPLNENEERALGIMSKTDRMMQEAAKMDPILTDMGERYVAEAILGAGGEIAQGQGSVLANQAFEKYVQDRAQQFGTMVPEQVQAARTYFSRAVQNALIAQKNAELQRFEAGSGRINANAGAARSGENQTIQWYRSISTSVESLRKAQNDLARATPGLMAALGNPQLAQSPIMAAPVARYNELEQQIEAMKGVQGSLADGQIPGNIREAVQAAETINRQGTTGAPAAPARPPAAGGPPPGTKPAVNIAGMVTAITGGKATLQDARTLMQQGIITQEQLNQITQQVNQKGTRGR